MTLSALGGKLAAQGPMGRYVRQRPEPQGQLPRFGDVVEARKTPDAWKRLLDRAAQRDEDYFGQFMDPSVPAGSGSDRAPDALLHQMTRLAAALDEELSPDVSLRALGCPAQDAAQIQAALETRIQDPERLERCLSLLAFYQYAEQRLGEIILESGQQVKAAALPPDPRRTLKQKLFHPFGGKKEPNLEKRLNEALLALSRRLDARLQAPYDDLRRQVDPELTVYRPVLLYPPALPSLEPQKSSKK